MDGLTNEEWLSRLGGDGAEREATIAALRDVIRRGLAKALRSNALADDAFLDDVTQDALLKVLDNLEGFRGDSRFTTWAIAVSIRVAFSELRRARWRDVSLDNLTDLGAAPEPTSQAAPGTRVEREELIGMMHDVMETQLTERQRFVLNAELNGVPQAEICARLDLNRNALYKLGHDARQKLKRGLEARGITEDDVRKLFAIAS